MEMVSAALLLFLIMDPLGNIPVFLSLLKPLSKKRQRIVLIRELLIEGIFGDGEVGEPFIVPMAIPLVAGPSGMAAVMLFGSQDPSRMGDWTMALGIAWFGTAVILFSSTYLYKVLGTRVLVALERLMGMLLVAISVQMLMDGIQSYLNTPA